VCVTGALVAAVVLPCFSQESPASHLDQLASSLKTGTRAERVAAVKELSAVGGESASAAARLLFCARSDPDTDFVYAASSGIKVLAKNAPRGVLEGLCALAIEDDSIGTRVADFLVRDLPGIPGREEALGQLLIHGGSLTRGHLLLSLPKLDDLSSGGAVFASVCLLIGNADLPDLTDRMLAMMSVWDMGVMGGPLSEALNSAVMVEHGFTCSLAAWLIGRQAHASDDCVRRLWQLAGSSDAAVRASGRYALWRCQKIDDPPIRDLAVCLKLSPSKYVIFSLGECGSAAEPALGALGELIDEEVRISAFGAVALQAMIRISASSAETQGAIVKGAVASDRALRAEGLRSLPYLAGWPDGDCAVGKEVVLAALRDRDDETWSAALSAVSGVGAKGGMFVEALAELLSSAARSAQVVRTLKAIDTPESVDSLLGALQMAGGERQILAISALRGMDSVSMNTAFLLEKWAAEYGCASDEVRVEALETAAGIRRRLSEPGQNR